mmetsp:Transcript_58277/g.142480  ORF Transcript_58277/g.142480 Transcript_58277/m.142480 type:complete len:343 (+) Transcript_58277:151-1179(+)
MPRPFQKLSAICRRATVVSEKRSLIIGENRFPTTFPVYSAFHYLQPSTSLVHHHTSRSISYVFSGTDGRNIYRVRKVRSTTSQIDINGPFQQLSTMESVASSARQNFHSSTHLYLSADDDSTDKVSKKSEHEKSESDSSSASEEAPASSSGTESSDDGDKNTDGGDDSPESPDDSSDGSDDEVRVTDREYAFTPPPPLSEESKAKVDGLLERILLLDMIEVHLLTQLIHEKLGVSWQEAEQGMTGGGGAGAGTGTNASAGGDGEAGEAAEEKTIFDLKLVGFDSKAKIKVIKEVRTIAGLGLKEAKEMCESAPKVIQKDLKQDKAEELKAQLEAVGAEVELV